MEKSYEEFVFSERLVIRPFSVRDVQPFYQYRSNPDTARYQSWENYTLQELRRLSANKWHNPQISLERGFNMRLL